MQGVRTVTYEKQPVPQVNVASASDDLSWNLTAADYKAWRKAFYADEGSEEIELNMLNAILKTSDRLAWRVVWTYFDSIECRPKEKVNSFKEPRQAS